MTSGESTYTLELPYRRSLGPVVGAFLTGLRDATVLGSRTAAGRVIVPPLEYDPDTGEPSTSSSTVGTAGTVHQWAWVAEPLRKHPLDRPVRLGARAARRRRHLAAARPRRRLARARCSTGMRVRIRWARRAHRPHHRHRVLRAGGRARERDTDASTDADEAGPVRFMQQLIALDYTMRVSPIGRRASASGLAEGRIIGHRCPSVRAACTCRPRAFCPMCCVATGDDDEVEVADRGIVTSLTVLTPIQYHGQKEREDYALASVLLDGADGTIGQQRLVDIAARRDPQGMRVEAVWAPPRTSARATPAVATGCGLRRRHHRLGAHRRARPRRPSRADRTQEHVPVRDVAIVSVRAGAGASRRWRRPRPRCCSR